MVLSSWSAHSALTVVVVLSVIVDLHTVASQDDGFLLTRNDTGTTTTPPAEKCTPCPPASFAYKGRGNNCSMLDKSGACSAINGSCPEAPPGYNGQGFRPAGKNRTLCTPCPPNMFNPSEGARSCEFCPDGHQPGLPRDHCSSCNDGEASNPKDTNGVCQSCFQLKKGWKGAANHTVCEACQPGFMSFYGIACSPCDPSFFWNPHTKNCLALCGKGYSCTGARGDNNVSYCAQCNACQAGFYQQTAGAYSCDICQPGTAQPQPGQIQCKDCVMGTFQDKSGQASCPSCPEGSYCPNATTKLPCPADEYCPEGSVRPSQCSSMYVPNQDGCKPTTELLAIIAGSVVAGTLLMSLLVYRRYRQYARAQTEASQLLLAKEACKHPVYSGL